ncbi:MAG: hypothetical protein ACRDGB_12370 [Candidatus Limnocylindria bacterium]
MFFLVAAVGQAGLAAVLVYRPMHSTARRREWRWLLPTLIVGSIANACIAALYVVTRTAGIPVGPDVGEVESLNAAGVLSTTAEVTTAAILFVVAATRRGTTQSPLSPTDTKSRRSGHVRDTELVFGVGAMIAVVATITELPVVITAREGGMGPGSALLLGEAVLVGATALGAGSAALAPRWISPGSLLLSSAAITMGAFVSAAFEDHVGLIAINSAYAVIGFAAGMAITELFARAAERSRGRRAMAVAALLVGAAAASRLAIVAAVPGLVWLVLACAFLAVLWWLQADSMAGQADVTDRGAPVVGYIRGGLSLLAIGAGIVATLASSDSTGMLAIMLSSPFGATDLAGLDASRATLLVVGVGLIAIGSVALWLRSRPAGSVVTATCAVALTGLAGAGTVVILAYIAPADVIPGQRALSGTGAVSLLATAMGMGLGAVCLARGISVRILAGSGATALGVVTLIVTGVGGGLAPAVSAPLGALAAAATAGLGMGVAFVALRFGLTLVPASLMRGAAAAGVTAAAFGSLPACRSGAASERSSVAVRPVYPVPWLWHSLLPPPRR